MAEQMLPLAHVNNTLSRTVVRVLRYFDIFSYPLTAEEVFRYWTPGEESWEGEPPSSAAIAAMLQELADQGKIFSYDGYFTASPEPGWVPRRLEANQRAAEVMPVANRMARLIGAFPFVRAVFVSGSLSKQSMQPDSDIDFFIVTEPGRLWVARTLLVLFKKIFLLNSRKYFCVNYFVDTEHLAIETRNVYTATETVTLLPLYGREQYIQFCTANSWAWQYFCHFPHRSSRIVPLEHRPPLKRCIEWVFGGRLGAWLDRNSMQFTVAYWRRKFRRLDPALFEQAFQSNRHVSRHHPLFFQKKVLEKMRET